MADAAPQHTPSRTALRSMRSTVGRESTTFGFSILVTVTFALLQTAEGSPSIGQIFLYATGAVMSFTLLEGMLSRGFRRPMPQHPSQTLALGTSLNIVSVLLALGAGLLVSTVAPATVAWTLAPLVAGIVYLAVESAETAIAEKVLRAAGDPEADQVSG